MSQKHSLSKTTQYVSKAVTGYRTYIITTNWMISGDVLK